MKVSGSTCAHSQDAKCNEGYNESLRRHGRQVGRDGERCEGLRAGPLFYNAVLLCAVLWTLIYDPRLEGICSLSSAQLADHVMACDRQQIPSIVAACKVS